MVLKQSYSRKTSPSQRTIFPRCVVWVIALSLMVVLVACGNGNTASVNGNTDPTPVRPTLTTEASTPTPSPTNGSTATPTVQPTPAPGLTQAVQITNSSNGSFGFSPATLTIKIGATVTWYNRSSAPHTVTSDDGQTFDSGNVLVGGTFHFTFLTAGTFPYHCNIHPYMRATIIVVST